MNESSHLTAGECVYLCSFVCMEEGEYCFLSFFITDSFKCLNGKNDFHAIFHLIKQLIFFYVSWENNCCLLLDIDMCGL